MRADFQVIGGSGFRNNPANFFHFEPKLEHLDSKVRSLKMLLYTGGVHILTEGVHILTHGVRILSVGMVFFIKNSSYITFLIIYYHAKIIILSVCFHRIYQ